MSSRLNKLYSARLMDYAGDASHMGETKEATHILKAYNPLCGDKFLIYLVLRQQIVEQASFKGYGCALSRASSNVLVQKLIGKSVPEISEMVSMFMKMIDSETNMPAEQLMKDRDLLLFSVARQFPERKKCVSLAWDELRAVL